MTHADILLGSLTGEHPVVRIITLSLPTLPSFSTMARPVGLLHRVADSGGFSSENPFTRYLVNAQDSYRAFPSYSPARDLM